MKYIQYYYLKCLFYTFFVVLLESIGGSYGETSNAFIFSLNNSEGLAPFMSKVMSGKKALAIYKHSDNGPGFGDDLVIEATISKSRARLGSAYSVPASVKDRFAILKGPEQYFSPDKVEVFHLDPSR